MPLFLGQIPASTPDTDLQLRLPARNVGASEIPSYGIVEIVDTVYDDIFGEMILEVQRPTTDSTKLIAINTEATIPVNAVGQVTTTFPTWVRYNDADGTPALNEQWGPAAGSYLAKKAKTGLLGVPMASGDNPPVPGVRFFYLELCLGGSGGSTPPAEESSGWEGFWSGLWPGNW